VLRNIFKIREIYLDCYVEDITRSTVELVNKHLGRNTVLTSELENNLVEYWVIMGRSYYGLRRQDIKRMVFIW
jgi:hypothetical protein